MRFLATLSPEATVIAADYFGPIVRGQLGIVTGCRRGTWLPWQRTAYVCTFLGGVMALPQPIIAKRELLAAMVLDGHEVDVDVVMQGIDEMARGRTTERLAQAAAHLGDRAVARITAVFDPSWRRDRGTHEG